MSSEWFPPGQEPVDFCSAHLRIGIDIRDGSIATAATPKTFIEPRTFVDLPAPYAAWVAKRGLPRKPRLGPAIPLSSALSPVPRLAIASPEDGLRLLSDPETPQSMATLALRAAVDPASQQVVWYVDGKPFQLVDYLYTARWPLAPGEHRFQVRLPHTEIVSNQVTVWIQ